MLEVRLCKPAVYKLKILVKGKFEYYKAMEGTKTKGGTKSLKFSGGKKSGGSTIFDLNLVVGKALEETMIWKKKSPFSVGLKRGITHNRRLIRSEILNLICTKCLCDDLYQLKIKPCPINITFSQICNMLSKLF